MIVEDEIARVVDTGALAGSTLTLDRALREVTRTSGVPLVAAVRAITANPARALGIDGEFGRLRAGHRADAVVLDDALTVRRVLADGRWLDEGRAAGGRAAAVTG